VIIYGDVVRVNFKTAQRADRIDRSLHGERLEHAAVARVDQRAELSRLDLENRRRPWAFDLVPDSAYHVSTVGRGSMRLKAICALVIALGTPAMAASLTFEDRVRAQEALERTYYSHRIGAAVAFQEAVPRSMIEDRVLNYLAQSVALEHIFGSPVTSEALDAELARIVRDTRAPDRLRELFDALGGDPVLVRECLVRPALVERLARERQEKLFPQVGWDAWWGENRLRFDTRLVTVVASHDPIPAIGDESASTMTCPQDNVWDRRILNATMGGRNGHTAVWTGTHMIVWGGAPNSNDNPLATGARYDPALDTATPTSTSGAPAGRLNHTAVWTGSKMVVWGGNNFSGSMNTGGRYDPFVDSWVATATAGAPSARQGHTAVWTGSSMLVWGGSGSASTQQGARYNPVSDTWLPMTTTGGPTTREYCTAVWTGTHMIVWGGGGIAVNTGGRYDPVADSWLPMGGTPPAARRLHVAAWTGSRMIVWGGSASGGGRYDPVSDSWTSISSAGAPPNRQWSTAVWTGSLFLVWGGFTESGPVAAAGRYDPFVDTWLPLSSVDAPSPRSRAAGVWTGSRFLLWSGAVGGNPINDGGSYVSSYVDADHDGFPACTQDCNDSNPAIRPGASELCNTIDDDCDGAADEGTASDDDGDGFTECGGDCNDANVGVFPGATEICNFQDDDCDGAVDDGLDGDGDGFTTCGGDCNDANPSVRPGAAEVCDLVDNDCDQAVDEGFDADGDGFTTCAGDCRDADPLAHPGAAERCNGVDDDCDLTIDEGVTSDDDGDGFTECGGDCNDGASGVHPGVVEVCNGVDDNCDGLTDNRDLDGDGYSACTNDCDDAVASTHPGAVEICGDNIDNNCNGYVDDVDADLDFYPCSFDCDDHNADVHPGHADWCGDHLDNNCNGVVDDDDADGDGVPCYADCAPNFGGMWRVPGETRLLVLNKSGTDAIGTWSHPTEPGGSVVSSDAIVSSSPGDFGPGSSSCVAARVSDPQFTDTVMPASGTARFYLTRAWNFCGHGTLGTRSDGTPRSAPACP
jgi:hypothetical protein